MKHRALIVGFGFVACVLALGGTTVPVASAGREVEQCLFSDDCAGNLVCENGRCRMQCRTDRDCAGGWRCEHPAGAVTMRCVAPPPPPAAFGFIVGRVDDTPGVPFARLSVQLDASRMSTVTDARGEFMFERVTPGLHEVTFVPPALSGRPPRTIFAHVDPAIHASVGTVTIAPGTGSVLTAPATMDLPALLSPKRK